MCEEGIMIFCDEALFFFFLQWDGIEMRMEYQYGYEYEHGRVFLRRFEVLRC